MDLIYRPELENPPMDKECTIGFTFIRGTSDPDYIKIEAGVTRDFPKDVWEKIKGYPVTKNLLKLNALRVVDRAPDEDGDENSSNKKVPVATADTLGDLPLPTALTYVEDSFDSDQLNRWKAKEQRVKVINAIGKRLEALASGEG